MQDQEIFVVIGQFLQDNMLCITEIHGHPYVGHFGETPSRQEASQGLMFATEIAQLDQRRGGVRAMIEAGDLEGKAVAVTWQDPVDVVYAEGVMPLLTDAGINVVAEIEVGAQSSDVVANEAAWDTVMLRIDDLGADLILNLSDIGPVLNAVERSGVEIEVAHTNGQAADGPTILEELIASDEVLSRSFARNHLESRRRRSPG